MWPVSVFEREIPESQGLNQQLNTVQSSALRGSCGSMLFVFDVELEYVFSISVNAFIEDAATGTLIVPWAISG